MSDDDDFMQDSGDEEYVPLLSPLPLSVLSVRG